MSWRRCCLAPRIFWWTSQQQQMFLVDVNGRQSSFWPSLFSLRVEGGKILLCIAIPVLFRLGWLLDDVVQIRMTVGTNNCSCCFLVLLLVSSYHHQFTIMCDEECTDGVVSGWMRGIYAIYHTTTIVTSSTSNSRRRRRRRKNQSPSIFEIKWRFSDPTITSSSPICTLVLHYEKLFDENTTRKIFLYLLQEVRKNRLLEKDFSKNYCIFTNLFKITMSSSC